MFVLACLRMCLPAIVSVHDDVEAFIVGLVSFMIELINYLVYKMYENGKKWPSHFPESFLTLPSVLFCPTNSLKREDVEFTVL